MLKRIAQTFRARMDRERNFIRAARAAATRSRVVQSSRLLLLCALITTWCAQGQQLLPSMPGYAAYARALKERTNLVPSGAVSPQWKEGGRILEYEHAGKRQRYNLEKRAFQNAATRTNAGVSAKPSLKPKSAGSFKNPSKPIRGRQYAAAVSPDGHHKAVYRGRNLWLVHAGDTNEVPITTEGNARDRVKLGTATWTYGEELDQVIAIWWSSNSQKVAFYRMDERLVPGYYVTTAHTRLHNAAQVEPYPKAGMSNAVPDILIYDVATRKTVQVDVRSGRPFTDDVPGHYVYGVEWSPRGDELLFLRTDRLQKKLQLCAANSESGLSRVIIEEGWPASWVENSPSKQFLRDGNRFIWSSERTGWKNLYLYDLSGKLLNRLTDEVCEVTQVLRVDEDQGRLYYMARSGDNYLKAQLHRVSLDGRKSVRLTDRAYHHAVHFAPDGNWFVDASQSHDAPAFSTLRDSNGAAIAELASSDLSRFKALKLRPVELFEFKAADDFTTLHGMLHFPSNFNPKRKYPLLVEVYAGPATSGAREIFTAPNVLTELGFLYATLDSRSANGRGKKFLDAIYQQLGVVEIDDQAAGVKALGRRKYVDKSRVGIFGTSYGGTAAALCLLRYPDVFQAACASSGVMDFRNYDTIYTERYLGLPQANPQAYDQVSVNRLANSLQRPLLIYFGTADDNVHPANSLQLIKALQNSGKSFEVQIGPDLGHTSLNRERMMEFFIQHLVLEPSGRRSNTQNSHASHTP